MVVSSRNSLLVSLVALLLGGLVPGQSRDQPSAPPLQGTPQGVPDSAGVTPGQLIKRVAPVYPRKARKKKIEGVVFLKAKITTDGDVADLSVISGDPLLVQAAIDAVKQWKYRPYLQDGKPVEVDTEIKVNFQLSGN